MWDTNKQKQGWGVIRVSPWRLAGIFESEAKATARQIKLGPTYIVRFGVGFAHSSDFFWDVSGD